MFTMVVLSVIGNGLKNILKNIIEQKVLEQNAYKSKKITKSKEYKQELEKLKQNLAYQIWLRDFSKTVKVKVDKLKKYYDKNKEITVPEVDNDLKSKLQEEEVFG